MRSKGIFVLAGLAFLLLVSSGCGGTPGGGTPTCPTSSLQAPVLASPDMWAVVDSLSPSLSWSYPNPACNPQGYAIDLKTGPFFSDHLGGGTGNPSTSWSPGSPLQPGKEYAWGVQAINGTTLGPYAGSRYFFTGPMCETDTLAAPTLLQPANGAAVTELEPSLIWQYPDPCLPQGYRVDLSTDMTFADTSLSGGTGNPSTRWGPAHPLADCTVYFWKITPINNTTLGPESGLFSFSTNASGTCPTPTPPGPTATPVDPTFTPTPPAPTSTPTQPTLFFTPNLNPYCRSGPGTLYESIDVALKGQPYLLDGRNAEGTWYRIMLTASKGCWVPVDSGVPSADTSGLRVLVTPPLLPSITPTIAPTFTPTWVVVCSSFTDEKSCNAQPACKWYVPSTTRPYCGNR
jgi:hypothetical protein